MLLAALAVARCGRTDHLPDDSLGRFHAVVTGVVSANPAGDGQFHFAGGESPYMGIELRAMEGDAAISLTLPGHTTVPHAGIYRIAAPAEAGTHPTTVLVRRSAGQQESFAGTSGEIVILQSPPDEVKGRFSFDASRYCASPIVGPRSGAGCSPEQIDRAAPRIRVRGTFRAVRDTSHSLNPI